MKASFWGLFDWKVNFSGTKFFKTYFLDYSIHLAPIAGLQLLLDSHKVFCPPGY